jgi:hypothetical protein
MLALQVSNARCSIEREARTRASLNLIVRPPDRMRGNP